MKFFPRRPSIPWSKAKRPEIFTTTGTSWYMEAYKSTAFPPEIKKYKLSTIESKLSKVKLHENDEIRI
jgi:hypothetical protein